jgi:hypothetical protein
MQHHRRYQYLLSRYRHYRHLWNQQYRHRHYRRRLLNLNLHFVKIHHRRHHKLLQ